MRLFLLSLPLLLAACGGPEEGDPCTEQDECGDMTCHIHEGDVAGTCVAEVEEHEHEHEHEDTGPTE